MAAALILEQVRVTEEDELQPGTQTACLHPVLQPAGCLKRNWRLRNEKQPQQQLYNHAGLASDKSHVRTRLLPLLEEPKREDEEGTWPGGELGVFFFFFTGIVRKTTIIASTRSAERRLRGG